MFFFDANAGQCKFSRMNMHHPGGWSCDLVYFGAIKQKRPGYTPRLRDPDNISMSNHNLGYKNAQRFAVQFMVPTGLYGFAVPICNDLNMIYTPHRCLLGQH